MEAKENIELIDKSRFWTFFKLVWIVVYSINFRYGSLVYFPELFRRTFKIVYEFVNEKLVHLIAMTTNQLKKENDAVKKASSWI